VGSGYLSWLDRLLRRRLAILLALVVALGFAMRYLPFLHVLSIGDTYYQYALTEHVLKQGSLPEVLPLRYYPHGAKLLHKRVLLPYFIAFSYRLVQPFGVSLKDYMIFFPAFFGALAAIPLFFLVKELFDERTAFIAVSIYVILPSSIVRTFAGFVEKESLAGILIYTWLYLFVRSHRSLSLDLSASSLFHSLLSGVFMALSIGTWGGAVYYTLLLATASFIHLLLKQDRALGFSLSAMCASSYALLHLIAPASYPLKSFLLSYEFAPLSYVAFLALLSALTPNLPGRVGRLKPLHVMASALLLSGLAVLYLNLLPKLRGMAEAMLRKSYLRSPLPPPAEALKLTEVPFGASLQLLTPLLLLIPLGFYHLRRSDGEAEFESAFLILWLITGSIAAYIQWRMLFIFAPAASIFIALALSKASSFITSPSKQRDLLILFLALYLASGFMALKVAGLINATNSDAVPYLEEAMKQLHDNTPVDSLVIAWWDYGYMVQALAERATIADPGGGFKRRVHLARIFTSPEDEAVRIIKRYNPYEKPVYLLVTVREVFAYPAIKETAGDEDLDIRMVLGIPRSGDRRRDASRVLRILAEGGSTIYWLNYPSEEEFDVIYMPNLDNPATVDNLLPRLLPFYEIPGHDPRNLRLFGLGEGLEHFKLVWDNGYAFIYRVQ